MTKSGGATNVVVIGASSAGLFAAYLLAQKGVPVRVYEASEAWDPLPRTLIVTSFLPQVLGFVPTEAVLNRVHHIELISRRSSAKITLQRPDLIIERKNLMRLLAKRARQAGAEIVPGHRFVEFGGDPVAGGHELRLRLMDLGKDRLREEGAALVIGADGVHSRVAGRASPRERKTVAVLQALVALPAETDPHTVRVWFDRDSTRFFYWLIPESKERAAVGLIAEERKEAEVRLQRFLDAHGFQPLSYQAAPVAVHRFVSRLGAGLDGGRVYLAGDAAGQVKMTTVGGLVAGLRGARAAAGAILGRKGYRWEMQELKRELDLQLLMRAILNRFTDGDYDELLRLLNSRTREVLRTYSRDEMMKGIWRLVLAQPRLLSLAARIFLRHLIPIA